MYLEKIEIAGFKSFAQKTTLIFPKKETNKGFGLTAVVGPNGSGKSNLLEAIRWALGEQRLRILRVKKSEDLIFSGGLRQSRANLASVSLFFNNEEGGNEIPWREFSICRRLYRSGESEYLINNIPARLQDILLVLAQANFGQKSYSIIGQGMIADILHLGPLDRRAFFEEATGVKGLQIKKEEAIHKLEKTKINLETATITLKEIEPRMRSLTRQIKKLERRQNLEEKLRMIQKQYYAIIWQGLLSLEEDLSKKYKQIENQYQKIDSELKDLQNKFSDLFSEAKIESLELKQNEYKNLLKIKNQYLEKKNELQSAILFEEEKIKIGQPQEIKIDPEKIWQEINELVQWVTNLIREVEKIHTLDEMAEVKEKLTKILEKMTSLKTTFKNPKKQIEQNSTLQELKRQYQNISQDLENVNQKINDLEKKLSTETQEEKIRRKEVFTLQKKIEIKQKEFNQLRESLNEIKIEQAKVKTRSDGLKEEIKQELTASRQEKEVEIILTELKKLSVTESKDKLDEEIKKLKRELEFIGGIDPEIKKEYPLVQERYEFLSKEIKDLKKSLDSLSKIAKELDQKINERFSQSFVKINDQFSRYFKMFFRGGTTKLVLRKNLVAEIVENEDIQKEVSEIEIIARPPKKQLKNIEALSGGESALTALALISAIIAINKPPFVILDEVDAALDNTNSFKFAQILKELSLKTQFIIITHNLQTIEAAKFLYGVTLDQQNTSKLVSLKLEKS